MAPSFFFGNPGIFTLGAILYAESLGPESKDLEEAVEEVLSY